MQSLPIPKTITVYQLIKMTTKTSLNFSTVGTSSSSSSYIGTGMYLTQSEAEQNRTMETLKDIDGNSKFFVFELEFPNPAYRE
jgi:hypothetical protein